SRSIQSLAERWEAEPAALEEALARQDRISRLQKKYGSTVEAILEHAEKLRGEIDRLENADTYRRGLEQQTQRAFQALEKAAQALSSKRRRAARSLGEEVQKQ